MFLLLLLVAVAIATLYYRWQRRKIYKLYKQLPTIDKKHYPVVGHAYLFAGTDEDRMDFWKMVALKAIEQGGKTTCWIGNRLYVVVCEPESIDLVLKNCPAKDEATYKFTRTVLGNGSIFAPVNIWRPRRKILAPVFNIKNLNQFLGVFNDESFIMTDSMKPLAGGEEFSVWNYVATYTFDSVCVSTLGVRLQSNDMTKQAVLEALERLLELISARMLSPWLHPDLVYKNLPLYSQFDGYRKVVFKLIDDIIKNKRHELVKIEQEGKESEKTGVMSFLDLMLLNSAKGSAGYSDMELREEIMVLIAAGTDTSAVGSSFTTVLLSRYPEIQEKLFKELQQVFGDSERPVTVEDLPKLKYLDVVVKESLRLYPPVPVIAREIQNDMVIPSGETLVDGVSVIINIWGTHRNPKFWGDDAEQFRPERFLEENALKNPAQFIPFSYSNRNCLGYNYATMSMKTVLANLVRRYKVLPPAGMSPAELKAPLRVKFDIMMKHIDDYKVSLWFNYSNKAYSALRVQYNNAFRMLLGLPRHCIASGMLAEARTDDFHAIMRKRVTSLMRRVRGGSNGLLAAVAERLDSPILAFWADMHKPRADYDEC